MKALPQKEHSTRLTEETPISSAESRSSHTTRLHHWYLTKKKLEDGSEYVSAHGNATGHPSLPDTIRARTTQVRQIDVNEEAEEVVIQTRNTEYHCRLSDCNFSMPDTYDLIPGLAGYAERFGKEKDYQLEDPSILLVLSDHDSYYFEALLVKEHGRTHKGRMYPHIGTFQDSCLLGCEEYDEALDLRYFPHRRHLEAYCWETGGLPVYLENTGDDILYFTANDGLMELKPGERKLVSEENVMSTDSKPVLDQSDLYPAAEVNFLSK